MPPGLGAVLNWLRKQLSLFQKVDHLQGTIAYQQRVIESLTYRVVRLEVEMTQLLGRKLISRLPPLPPPSDTDLED